LAFKYDNIAFNFLINLALNLIISNFIKSMCKSITFLQSITLNIISLNKKDKKSHFSCLINPTIKFWFIIPNHPLNFSIFNNSNYIWIHFLIFYSNYRCLWFSLTALWRVWIVFKFLVYWDKRYLITWL